MSASVWDAVPYVEDYSLLAAIMEAETRGEIEDADWHPIALRNDRHPSVQVSAADSCNGCGRSVSARSSYCSNTCRQRAYRKRQRAGGVS